MITHPETNRTNERGALMLEAIALLGLMTMMSPMVVRQTADRTAEMEEITIAGQMKDLRDALNNYIETNYNTWYGELHTSELSHTYSVNAEQLSSFLPTSAVEFTPAGEDTPAEYSFRGNKLADDFDIAVLAECIEMRRANGAAPVGVTYSNGAVSSPNPDANQYCSRYKMSGIILSNNGEGEIDDRRAARIASMIGADGGYTRTNQVVEAFGGDADEIAAAKLRILGSQGIWEGNAATYFGEDFGDHNPTGRIAVTTSYSSGISGDYLYRKQVNGLPEANSMFTDLDMGGNGACVENTGCNRINNAGGLEVVQGRILIRSANNAAGTDDQDPDTADAFAQIALGLASSRLAVNDELNFQVGDRINPNAALNMKDGETTLTSNNSISLARAGNRTLTMNNDGISLSKDDNRTLTMNNDGITAAAGDANLQLANQNAKIGFGDNAANTSITLTNNDNINIRVNGTHQFDLAQGKAITQVGDSHFNLYGTAGEGAEISVGTGATTHKLTLKDDDVSLSFKNDAGYLSFDNDKALLNHGSGQADIRSGQITLNTGNADFSLKETELSANLADNAVRFLLNSDEFSANLADGRRLAFTSNDGLKLINHGTDPSIQLNSASGRISAGFFQPDKIMLSNGALGNPVQSRGKLVVNEITGQTTASYEPDLDDNDATVTINYAGYFSNGEAALEDHWTSEDINAQHPYKFHQEQDAHQYYRRFRVDPAFTSVMNDIKLTSRGGARLSEALPNYILKGIYVLSNSYSAGGWPCGIPRDDENNPITDKNTCDFDMPFYRLTEIGVSEGGFEFNCSENTIPHPITIGGGFCQDITDPAANPPTVPPDKSVEYVKFSYNSYQCNGTQIGDLGNSIECPENKRYDDDQYVECEGTCWAHPFMGKVPAPGRSIEIQVRNESVPNSYSSSSFHSETLYAQDEGVCPDGYQAVLTVTPNKFELGKYLAYDEEAGIAGANVRYNFGYLNYRDPDFRSATAILQSGTGLAIHTESELDIHGQIKGWRIAMGTVTPTNDGSYVWNMGGIYTNSWQAVAHTYCYFNPNRFTMPNMRFKKMAEVSEHGDANKKKHGTALGGSEANGTDDVILTPMDNPLGQDSDVFN